MRAHPLGNGGDKQVTLTQGPFAGREVGGGLRSQVYGTSIYGSGYPGRPEPGVEGKGFPFTFFPVVYAGNQDPRYLYRQVEYGDTSDPTRPGGSLYQFSVHPQVRCGKPPPYIFHILSDNATIQFLNTAMSYSCTSANAYTGGVTVTLPIPYNGSGVFPLPQETIQYYRGSSVVLALQGYNNSAAFDPVNSPPIAEIPANISSYFLNCVNQTIGLSVPLIGGATLSQAFLSPFTTLTAILFIYFFREAFGTRF